MPEPEKRTENVKVPMSITEKREIEAAAARSGMPTAVFLRSLALQAARGAK